MKSCYDAYDAQCDTKHFDNEQPLLILKLHKKISHVINTANVNQGVKAFFQK